MRRNSLCKHPGAGEALDLARDRFPRELNVVVAGVDPRIVGELRIGVESEPEPVLRRLKLVAPRGGHVLERELRTTRAIVGVVAVEDVELRLETVFLVCLLEGREQRVAPTGLLTLLRQIAEDEEYVVKVERGALARNVLRAPDFNVGDCRPELIQ